MLDQTESVDKERTPHKFGMEQSPKPLCLPGSPFNSACGFQHWVGRTWESCQAGHTHRSLCSDQFEKFYKNLLHPCLRQLCYQRNNWTFLSKWSIIFFKKKVWLSYMIIIFPKSSGKKNEFPQRHAMRTWKAPSSPREHSHKSKLLLLLLFFCQTYTESIISELKCR